MSERTVTLTLCEVEHTKVPLSIIADQLAAQGLHVVSAEDKAMLDARTETPLGQLKILLAHKGLHVVSAAEKAVLDAGNLVLDSSLRRIADENGGCLADWARAELARREAKP